MVLLTGLEERLQLGHDVREGGPQVGGEIPTLQHQFVPETSEVTI